MIRKRIKYIKGFILFALFSILAFSPLCFIGAHAYHIDSNGNLVSDNLIPYVDNSYTTNGLSFNITNNGISVDGTSTSSGYNAISYNINLTPGVYTFSSFGAIGDNATYFSYIQGGGNIYGRSYEAPFSFTLTNNLRLEYRIVARPNISLNNVLFQDMLVKSSNYPDSFEPYNAVYYSQNNYDNAYYRNYGLLGYCSKITVQINADPVINDEWNGIQELLNDKSYITMNNNVFNINWSSFNMDYTNGSTYYTSWKFYFDNTYPSVNLYNSFTSTIVNGNYQLVSSNVDLLSYGSIPSGDTVDFSTYSNYNYGRFDWNCSTPGIASNWASLYFTNTNSNDYINGYNDGKNDGIDYADSNVNVNSASYLAGSSTGYNDGKNDGIDYANTHVNTDSASYQAGVSSQGGYNAGYSAGYAKGRTEQSYITNTNTQGNDLIWTIASTPWESFKNIWNVNVLGINLANLVTGFITAIILLWIIKRFWK